MYNKVYVASSWRNPIQVAVVAALKSCKIECYDFRNPTENNTGFHWSEVMPSFPRESPFEIRVPVEDYIKALDHPISNGGFNLDFAAMEECDACILVLPSGRSSHLEVGWFIGQGKPTAILLDGPTVQPELMYKMADYLAPSLFDLLGWLGVRDD